MKLVKFLSLIILALFITNLIYTNKLVGQGREITILSQQIDAIEHDNKKLQLIVAEKGSLTKLNEEITAQGFVEPTTFAVIEKPSNVALGDLE